MLAKIIVSPSIFFGLAVRFNEITDDEFGISDKAENMVNDATDGTTDEASDDLMFNNGSGRVTNHISCQGVDFGSGATCGFGGDAECKKLRGDHSQCKNENSAWFCGCKPGFCPISGAEPSYCVKSCEGYSCTTPDWVLLGAHYACTDDKTLGTCPANSELKCCVPTCATWRHSQWNRCEYKDGYDFEKKNSEKCLDGNCNNERCCDYVPNCRAHPCPAATDAGTTVNNEGSYVKCRDEPCSDLRCCKKTCIPDHVVMSSSWSPAALIVSSGPPPCEIKYFEGGSVARTSFIHDGSSANISDATDGAIREFEQHIRKYVCPSYPFQGIRFSGYDRLQCAISRAGFQRFASGNFVSSSYMRVQNCMGSLPLSEFEAKICCKDWQW